MGIKAQLLKIYFAVEATYYSLCDSLEKNGLPIYEYFVEPIEKNKLPSFPIALAALLALAGLAALAFQPLPLSVKTVHVTVLGNNSQPLQGALAELLTVQSQVVASALTDENGETFFPDAANAVQVKVTHPEYEEMRGPVREQVSLQLVLRSTLQQRQDVVPAAQEERFVGDVSQFIETQQFGSFAVRVGSAGLPLESVVRVFDAVTDNELMQAQSVGGNVIFENLPVNQHVYFHALAPGFTANRTPEFAVRRERQSVGIEMQRVESFNSTISVISSLTRQPLSGTKIKIFDENNVEIINATIPTTGNISLTLPRGSYYVNAKKDNFATNLSPFFQAGENVVIAMLPASAENSSTLAVLYRDEYDDGIQGMSTLYLDGKILDQASFQASRHDYRNLQRGINVSIRASSRDLFASATALLSEPTQEVVIQLEVRFAFLSFSAFDALTREAVRANVSVTRNSELFGNCVAPCALRVKTRGVHFVEFSNQSYFNYTFGFGRNEQHQVFEEGSTTELNASMMPLAGVQDSQVVLNGVFDASTYERVLPGEAIKQNRVYLASVSGFFVNAEKSGVFFSPSNTSGRISVLNFTPFPGALSAPEGLEARVSTNSLQSDCGAGLAGNKWKRSLLMAPVTGVQNYEFFFVAEPGTSSDFYDELLLKYKSFIQRQGEVVRNPFDQRLGTGPLEFTGSNSECSAQAYEERFAVVSPNEDANSLGKLGLNFRQERQLSVVQSERTNRPASCGFTTGATEAAHFESFDCNGFPVDSGFARTFSVDFDIRLNRNAKGGIIKFYANPAFFSLLNASLKVENRDAFVPQPRPAGPVFEYVVPPVQFTGQGSRNIQGVVNLSGRGTTSRSEISMEFIEIFENGSVNEVTLNKSVWVSVNQVSAPSTASLLEGFSCANQQRINFSYDDGLLATGSGWIGCDSIPMVIDPVFPADAVPIYVENATGAGNCVVGEEPDFDVRGPVPNRTSPNGQNCFELVEDDDLEPGLLAPFDGYKGYVLKFNAQKCGGVIGNGLFATNATLELVCRSRNPRGIGFDNKTVNITVINQGGNWVKNLHVSKLVSSTNLSVRYLRNGGVYFYNPPAGADTCPAGSHAVFATSDGGNVFELGEGHNFSLPLHRGSGGGNNVCEAQDVSTYLNFVHEFVDGSAEPTRSVEIEDTGPFRACMPRLTRSTPMLGGFVHEGAAPYERSEAWGTQVFGGFYLCGKRSSDSSPPTIPGINTSNYVFAFAREGYRLVPLDPEVFAVVDNLQLRRLGADKRSLSAWPFFASEAIAINGQGDQQTRAFALAVARNAPSDLLNTMLLEDNNFLTQEIEHGPVPIPLSGADAFLERVQDAEQLRLATAFRRSPSPFTPLQGAVNYYCLEGAGPSPDTSICRPTINDWVKTVSAEATQRQACTPCSSSVCDAACNRETRSRPDGSQCFNWCDVPICVPASTCHGGTMEVSIGGRTTQEWINTSNLVPVPLYQVFDPEDVNFKDAPFKFFSEYTRGNFVYTMVVKVDKQCSDSPSNFWQSDSCFADQNTREVLERHGGLPPNFEEQWFGVAARGYLDEIPASLLLTERLGGCSQSTKWDRGYYWLSFTYDAATNSWSYAAAPLEVSSNYIQTESDSECRATSLLGNRRTKLCYALFTTWLNLSQEGPGYCLRSLRDYISLNPSDTEPEYISGSAFSGLIDDRPAYPVRRLNVPGRINIRDMEIEAFGRLKGGGFTCIGGPVCEHDWKGVARPAMSFDLHTFGVNNKGDVQWLVRGTKNEDDATCDASFDEFILGRDDSWATWDNDEGDESFAVWSKTTNLIGNIEGTSPGPVKAYTGCYIDCDSEGPGGCPGSYD